MFFFPFTCFYFPPEDFSVTTAAVVDAVVVVVVVVVDVGRSASCIFLPGHDLDMWPEAPQEQLYGQRPSTTTSNCLSGMI